MVSKLVGLSLQLFPGWTANLLLMVEPVDCGSDVWEVAVLVDRLLDENCGLSLDLLSVCLLE